ncbi:MAG: 2-oxoacid:acceptor oxidoreductase family protein [Calditrichaeota bacterium]|nr:2-oxoacid:acceptor oxidoreductase family protein [Calditrichota bacterium]MCB9367088.1 2-oxoacid:acceptor oxidoreductase family protein [Calditrichota bacterium]MCB9391428.1 2-oxoacid:acceptor oxidoreductase family protein [Calditrichota bacterium]
MSQQVLEKPHSFYEKFDRKGGPQKTTHYCPGCGHGNVHKLIAETIDEMGLADRTVFISPVGCSVFAYYYFDVGNIQAAHGRAPAVGTGVKRTRHNSIVISYQGDGDLASIGTAEIIHAANRGEQMTVFFINNGIYGMTGGQMAATSLLGQKTATTPYGRTVENEGYPIHMAEVIATLEAPVFVARTHLADLKGIMNTRKCVRKAVQAQVEGKGFTFVEILSPCPTGWKMDTHTSCEYIVDKMLPVFPDKVFKDLIAERESYVRPDVDPTDEEVLDALDLGQLGEPFPKDQNFLDNFPTMNFKFAGFGGQGVLTAGAILAAVGMQEHLQVSWIPSYGPEMRGGTANASVVLSNKPVGSPMVVKPDVLAVMNDPSMDAFEETIAPGGLMIVNSTIITRKAKRTDIETLYIPLTQIADDMGLKAAANMVLLGAYLEYSKLLPVDHLKQIVPRGIKRKQLGDQNIEAVEAGAKWVRENVGARKAEAAVTA